MKALCGQCIHRLLPATASCSRITERPTGVASCSTPGCTSSSLLRIGNQQLQTLTFLGFFSKELGFISSGAKPHVLLCWPWCGCSFLPLTSGCLRCWLGTDPSWTAESWGEARCGYERGRLVTGIWMGECRKVHCLGELTPLLAGVLLTAVFGHMT